MKRTLIAALALASTSIFAQTAEINGQEIVPAPIPQPTRVICEDFHCALMQSRLTNVMVQSDNKLATLSATSREQAWSDYNYLCDLASASNVSNLQVIIKVNFSQIAVGSCK